VVKNHADPAMICDAVDSPANGITLCTGLIAEDPENNVYDILAKFTRRRRRHFWAHMQH
jgi:D-mannonate dehydratase